MHNDSGKGHDLKRTESCQTGGMLRVDNSVAQSTVIQAEQLQRRLNNRQIQLIAIGGSIGTGLFISIGSGLHSAGPAGLLLAFIFYCFFVGLVNNGMAEMMTQYPVAGGFIRIAGHFVDEAFGFAAGWNFFIYEALVIPFEISALAVVVQYWSHDIPIWTLCLACVILYTLINGLVVSAYGETEFWLSSGKVILVLALFLFTFITMVGGNPQGDAYGFRNWNHPEAFAEVRTTGSLGRFEGFLAALWVASFCIVGPEYISLVSAEAKHPRKYIKAAYKTIYIRFFFLFLGSAIAVGIVLPSDDKTLTEILIGGGSGGGTAAASPYVIAMRNMGITVFPHVVNALLVTSIFSAGNTYVYCASRSLYSLALEGRAPAFLKICTKQGVPVYALALTMAFACLSFLQQGKQAARVLSILVNLVTGGALVNYLVMSITYVFYHQATKVQGIDRKNLPYYGWGQPYCGYAASVFFSVVIGTFGYTSFSPFDVGAFFGCYAMTILSILFYIFWKVFKRTSIYDPKAVDLVWETPQVDAYEAEMMEESQTFWGEMGRMILFRNSRGIKK
ncbi:General amino acid permease AGP2-like protein 2 [Colletotrichum limetticola]|uniref:General amino acid permease AGP2-like protein 2 n=1 Tax=Colletotrichum limetticola TaxID=1209924 RepID=A0ABQ9PBR4_9PEZI|nr:General amino acid permease AGP2-like protein 2 [Colletotrichum limetticola]